MKFGINKAIVLGRLGKDPEVRYTQNGTAICNLTLATSEKWKDKNSGEEKEQTEWHKVSIFGKVAEIAGENLQKGDQCYVEGQIRTRKWQDNEGNDRYTTEIVVQGFGSEVQWFKSSGGGQRDTGEREERNSKPAAQTDFDDDIPF